MIYAPPLCKPKHTEDCVVARILLIENDVPRLRLMGWGLIEEGFDVVVARSADEAIGRIESLGPAVIIFNTTLDVESKRACVLELRRKSPDVRIIDVSDDPDVSAGADALLIEPVTIADLAKQIHAWMA